ncbi:MAG: hypothetical protein CVV02_02095 [Firmicutes bacterium HGW-Firmicutes-7]|nr:MAG: hypothetical protein CVV02_02095 [Firmicutes bacterium HGW-Firmicutes-7]
MNKDNKYFTTFLLIHFLPTLLFLFLWLISILLLHFIWNISIFTNQMLLIYVALYYWYLLSWNLKQEIHSSRDQMNKATNKTNNNKLTNNKLITIEQRDIKLLNWQNIRILNFALPLIFIVIGLCISYCFDSSSWSRYDQNSIRVYSISVSLILSNLLISIKYFKQKRKI